MRDALVPPPMLRRLHDSATSSVHRALHVVEDGDHNDTFMKGGAAYVTAMRQFIAEALRRALGAAAADAFLLDSTRPLESAAGAIGSMPGAVPGGARVHTAADIVVPPAAAGEDMAHRSISRKSQRVGNGASLADVAADGSVRLTDAPSAGSEAAPPAAASGGGGGGGPDADGLATGDPVALEAEALHHRAEAAAAALPDPLQALDVRPSLLDTLPHPTRVAPHAAVAAAEDGGDGGDDGEVAASAGGRSGGGARRRRVQA